MVAIGQIEAIEATNNHLQELNSRIADGEFVIEMCREQMRRLKKRKFYAVEILRACEQGNYGKLLKIGNMIENEPEVNSKFD